jgi:PAS domain S-box-containing protein
MGEVVSFEQQLEIARQRVKTLMQIADGVSGRQTGQMVQLLRELSTSLKELEASGEDLRQQKKEATEACKALEIAHRRLRELFEFAPDGYLVTNGQGIIQRGNRVAAVLLEVHQDYLVGKPLISFVSEGEREIVQSRLEQLQGGASKVRDWRLLMKPWEGDPFWVEVTVTSQRDLESGAVHLLWLLRYVTERKRTEEELQESEERYRAIADNIRDGLTIIEDGRVVYFNDRACEIFGYPRDRFVKLTSLDFAAPEERERLQQVVEKVRRTGVPPAELEYWIVCKDGTRRCVLNRYSNIPKPDGSVARLVVTTDITESRQAEQALRESEARYRAIFETTGTATVIVEEDMVISLANAEFEQLSGYLDEELVGKKRMLEFVSDDDLEGLEAYHRVCSIDPDAAPDHFEFRFIDRQGGVRNVLLTIAKVPGTYRCVASLLDITERKQASDTLERRAAQLALLSDIGGKIAAVSDLGGVLDRAAHLAQEGFGYQHVGLFAVDRERGELVMRARAGDFADLYPEEHRLKLGQGMVGWVGESGESLLANDVEKEERYVNLYPDVVKTRSELSVPIRAGEEIVGALDVQSPQLDAFDGNDVTVMETLASQIAAAIENARLYEELQQELKERKQAEETLQRRAAQLALLNDIGGKIAGVTDLDSLLDRAARLVQERFGYHHVGLFTVDREKSELVMRAKAGDFADLYPSEHRLKLGQGMVGWVGQSGESLLANDVGAEKRYVNLYPDAVPTRSELSVPIRVGDEIVGTLDVQSPQINAFDEDDVMVIETLASQIAAAIENARCLE